jgi:hypothetical protein
MDLAEHQKLLDWFLSIGHQCIYHEPGCNETFYRVRTGNGTVYWISNKLAIKIYLKGLLP